MVIKKHFLFVILLAASFHLVNAQKRNLDNFSHEKWEHLKDYAISNDGRYMWYKYGIENSFENFVIQTIDGRIIKKYFNAYGPVFTPNSKYLLFKVADSLAILNLSNVSVKFVKGINSFQVPNGKWVAYRLGNTQNELVLSTNDFRETRTYFDVIDYYFNNNGSVLIIKTSNKLIWVDLKYREEKIIVNGELPSEVSFSHLGDQVAFIIRSDNGNVLRYYRKGLDSALIYATNRSIGIRSGMEISSVKAKFNEDGDKIYFGLQRSRRPNRKFKDSVITDKVNIWHYKDEFLQSDQLHYLPVSNQEVIGAVISNSGKNLIQLHDLDTFLLYDQGFPYNNYVLCQKKINLEDRLLKKEKLESLMLVSSIDGKRDTVLERPLKLLIKPFILPNERFVIWFDSGDKNFYSYEISTRVRRNITARANAIFYDDESAKLLTQVDFGVAGWCDKDSTLIIYDRYDLWKIDPRGDRHPINITNGYGRKNNIIFRSLPINRNFWGSFQSNNVIILAAFNRVNKHNGFWKLELDYVKNPIECSMGPYAYYFPATSPSMVNNISNKSPIKARDKEVYIVQRMSYSEAPNIYATKDLKFFSPLSHINPQKSYNWMTADLFTWSMPNGKLANGILYKPENFDTTKKYPVIFNYYEKRSDNLFLFQEPGLSNAEINIPWFVSNGYVIAVPDIDFTIPGQNAKNASDAIVSAAKYLTKFPWIDSMRMGLQGHSFAGGITNQIIAHTEIFTAAAEGAGVSDAISSFGGIGRQAASEIGQGNYRTTPWDNPKVFINNSPLLFAKNIKTPLLMMHNRDDTAVPFSQAIELFLALRRLGKPVWLLEYDGEGHSLYEQSCTLDFSIRIQQFFNHYLKDEPPPVWMTKGVSAEEKGKSSGLLLDKTWLKNNE